MLYGPPGTGKTSLFQALGTDPKVLAWASEASGLAMDAMPVVTLSAPELNVEDLLGVPTVLELTRRFPDGLDRKVHVTQWALPAVLDPTTPFLLFIDEPNRCDPSVRNALFQLVTFRTTTAGFKLPKGSLVCMAGNRMEDRAGARALDTAFNNRCGHFELALDVDSWLDWAGAQSGFSPLVRAFIARHPDLLCRFDATSTLPQQPTPRTWAGVGMALGETPDALRQSLIHGLVGHEAATIFAAFGSNENSFPTAEEILCHPETVAVPNGGNLDRAWIYATRLSDLIHWEVLPMAVDDDTAGCAIGTVFGRLAGQGFEDVATFAIRGAWRRIEQKPAAQETRKRFFALIKTLVRTPSFAKFISELRSLHGPAA